jgi:hypothetical protein
MPTISRFHGIAIEMYFNDHGFPHFHAWAAGRHAKIRIDNFEVLENTVTRKQLSIVLTWAHLHQIELEENWRRARNSETLRPIEPLP